MDAFISFPPFQLIDFPVCLSLSLSLRLSLSLYVIYFFAGAFNLRSVFCSDFFVVVVCYPIETSSIVIGDDTSLRFGRNSQPPKTPHHTTTVTEAVIRTVGSRHTTLSLSCSLQMVNCGGFTSSPQGRQFHCGLSQSPVSINEKRKRSRGSQLMIWVYEDLNLAIDFKDFFFQILKFSDFLCLFHILRFL